MDGGSEGVKNSSDEGRDEEQAQSCLFFQRLVHVLLSVLHVRVHVGSEERL